MRVNAPRAFDSNSTGYMTATGFVVVSAPAPLPLEEASFFCDRLRELELPLAALIFNRVCPSGVSDPE